VSAAVVPLSLKDAPALIERLLPVQRLSAESFEEQEGKQGKTLTTLGSYWKGRKPLVLNKACILGCLLPATSNPVRDLNIFEMLMGMDDESFVARSKRRPKPKEILEKLPIQNITDYFKVLPEGVLPPSAPIDWVKAEYCDVRVSWRDDLGENERRKLEARMLARGSYKDRARESWRPEEVEDTVYDHVWNDVNAHLGTAAHSFAELVEQLGIMRFGHVPRVADPFCGSGQIPFESARLGCETFAGDLNPVACMLTWGAFNIVGGTDSFRAELRQAQEETAVAVQRELDSLEIETDGGGWRPKTFLYCVEVTCPQTGWDVPLLPTRVISKARATIAELVPDPERKRYEIAIRSAVSDTELVAAEKGTVEREGRFGDAYLVHRVNGTYKTNISTLRGDYERPDGSFGNRVRPWSAEEFRPRPDDIFRERLYCIQWMRKKDRGNGYETEFRAINQDDLDRETLLETVVARNIADWQRNGWLPDMRIEPGGPPRYEGLSLIRGRGWTHWAHLFSPRQLMFLALTAKYIRARQDRFTAPLLIFLARLCDWSSKLCRYGTGAARESVAQTFYNQALNTLYAYGVRSFYFGQTYLLEDVAARPISGISRVIAQSADKWEIPADIFITDPPYGDAVRYEEILDFFIGWLRRNPPPELADWIWDSRRALAIKGDGEDFRRGMVAAYRRLADLMPDNGIQVVMFTHQSGSIWADMANIVWASGMHVTAAWYVVTETESALREGSYVKGTVLLVLRKSHGRHKTTRDELAWEIQEEVERQVADLTGLNQQSKGRYREENVFEDADIQMAGYAAALRVLTRYAVIDGRDMTAEAIRPRVKDETTFVDGLIAFAVSTANQCLVPQGLAKGHWDRLSGAERFYLKMLDMESHGAKSLDNYQNFAKAFKVRDFKPLLASYKANDARLKSALEFARAEMSEGSELYQSVLRAALYAVMELVRNIDGGEVLAHLMLNIPNYYGDMTQRELVVELSDYLAKRLDSLRPDEASAARVLRELVKNQRLG
jgi:putative DNA methylase